MLESMPTGMKFVLYLFLFIIHQFIYFYLFFYSFFHFIIIFVDLSKTIIQPGPIRLRNFDFDCRKSVRKHAPSSNNYLFLIHERSAWEQYYRNIMLDLS